MSWLSADGSLSLVHEQTHFNIDELIRRSFIKDVFSHPLNEKMLVRHFQHFYFLAMLSRQLMHTFYDIETDYHRNTAQQQLWNEKLLHMLDQLHQYSVTDYEWKID